MGSRTSYNRIRKHRQRARKHITRLLLAQDGKCHWCQAEIFELKALPGVVRANCRSVLCIVDGVEHRKLLATIDHLNGPLDNSKMVAACYTCNNRRGAIPRSRRIICISCGGPKPDNRFKKCLECRGVHGRVFTDRGSSRNAVAAMAAGIARYGCHPCWVAVECHDADGSTYLVKFIGIIKNQQLVATVSHIDRNGTIYWRHYRTQPNKWMILDGPDSDPVSQGLR